MFRRTSRLTPRLRLERRGILKRIFILMVASYLDSHPAPKPKTISEVVANEAGAPGRHLIAGPRSGRRCIPIERMKNLLSLASRARVQ